MNKNIAGSVALSDHLKTHTQYQAADQLDISRAAIQQMIRHKRNVYLKEIEGRWYYMEVGNWRRGPRGASEVIKAA